MPEAAVFRARISIKNPTNIFSGELDVTLLGFLVENKQKISRKHVIQRVDRPIDYSLVIDVQIYPRLYMIEISRVARPQIDKILAIEIERLRIAPALQRLSRRKTFDG